MGSRGIIPLVGFGAKPQALRRNMNLKASEQPRSGYEASGIADKLLLKQ